MTRLRSIHLDASRRHALVAAQTADYGRAFPLADDDDPHTLIDVRAQIAAARKEEAR